MLNEKAKMHLEIFGWYWENYATDELGVKCWRKVDAR